MNHSIFIKTYEQDLEWCRLCVKSIKRYAKDFHECVVAAPNGCGSAFDAWDAGGWATIYQSVRTADKGNGYIYQQYVKMMADTMTGGDMVHYVDSDCHFTRPFTPEDFMRDGKPILYITPFSEVGSGVIWKACTEKALGWECHFETMRRLPWLAPTALLQEFRRFIEMKHGKSFRDWALSHDGTANNSLSEFNAMGNFFLRMFPDEFYILDTTKEPLPANPCVQMRSWDGLTEAVKERIEGVIA